jgi:hypothetical protein
VTVSSYTISPYFFFRCTPSSPRGHRRVRSKRASSERAETHAEKKPPDTTALVQACDAPPHCSPHAQGRRSATRARPPPPRRWCVACSLPFHTPASKPPPTRTTLHISQCSCWLSRHTRAHLALTQCTQCWQPCASCLVCCFTTPPVVTGERKATQPPGGVEWCAAHLPRELSQALGHLVPCAPTARPPTLASTRAPTLLGGACGCIIIRLPPPPQSALHRRG